jgi:adenosylcobinamide-GDP ribazoletransferase
MENFLTALQFLTRIRLVRQSGLTPAAFGASVRYFPLVGAIIGVILAAACYLAQPFMSVHTLAVALVILEFALTGILHYDGLMDSADGLMSGRSRERKLEIMKDSRVGASGVVVVVFLILAKLSFLLDLLGQGPAPLAALFAMPILGRFAMVVAIPAFPYARPEGMGKAFAELAGYRSLLIAGAVTFLLVAPLGLAALAAMAAAILSAAVVGNYATRHLGGLTGDIYGAVTEITETVVLVAFVIACDWSAILHRDWFNFY